MRHFALSSVGFLVTACVAEELAVDFSAAEPELFATEPDQYVPAAAPAQLRDADNQALHPVHVNLLRDGRVLLVGKNGNAGIMTPTPIGSVVPATITLARATAPVDIPPGTPRFENRYDVVDSLFCMGHTQLADGSFFSVGGTRFIHDVTADWIYILGLGYGTRFDGTAWNRTPGNLSIPGSLGEAVRWYPQATKLADGRVLVLSGYEMPLYGPAAGPVQLGPTHVSAEVYDPVTRAFTPMTGLGETPISTFNPDYSHVFTLPYVSQIDGYVLGESAAPTLFAVTEKFWTTRLTPRPGNTLRPDGTSIMTPNNGASSVMLPIRLANTEWGYFNGAALVAGGAHGTLNERSLDVYDPIADRWLPRVDMEVRRHHPSTVLMPDGRVLVIAGHDDTLTSGARIRKAIFVDPKTAFRVTEGTSAMGEVRGYHTITLLLPDGRVLVGGGRTGGPDTTDDEKPNLRYYHPPYLSRVRPVLSLAPTVLRYGQNATIAHTGSVTEVVLIALGSMTHSFDSHQRYVQLARTAVTAGVSTITGPADAQTAPPGYYMLFVLDANRTPSIARIVQVTP